MDTVDAVAVYGGSYRLQLTELYALNNSAHKTCLTFHTTNGRSYFKQLFDLLQHFIGMYQKPEQVRSVSLSLCLLAVSSEQQQSVLPQDHVLFCIRSCLRSIGFLVSGHGTRSRVFLDLAELAQITRTRSRSTTRLASSSSAS